MKMMFDNNFRLRVVRNFKHENSSILSRFGEGQKHPIFYYKELYKPLKILKIHPKGFFNLSVLRQKIFNQ